MLPYPTPHSRPPIPIVTFFQIFRLFLWAVTADIGALVIATWLHASNFVTIMLVLAAGSAVWLARYESLAESRGWESLRIRFSTPGPKPLLIGVAVAIALWLLLVGTITFLEWLGIHIVIPPDPLLFAHGLDGLPALIFIVAFLAPLSEELIFRGLILDWLNQALSPAAAAVISSLLFALVHDNHLLSGAVGWVLLCDRFLMGMAACWLVTRYQSLAPAFAMHATNNFAFVVANSM